MGLREGTRGSHGDGGREERKNVQQKESALSQRQSGERHCASCRLTGSVAVCHILSTSCHSIQGVSSLTPHRLTARTTALYILYSVCVCVCSSTAVYISASSCLEGRASSVCVCVYVCSGETLTANDSRRSL